MVQAMISEKSRGGGSTRKDLLVSVLKTEFLAAPEKQRKMWQLWARPPRGDDRQESARPPPEGGEGSGCPTKPGAKVFHVKRPAWDLQALTLLSPPQGNWFKEAYYNQVKLEN